MYQYTLIELVIHKLKLDDKLEDISDLSTIKIHENNEIFINILKSYQNPTREEKYIIDIFASNEIQKMNYLSDNYKYNLFFDIHLIICNPYSIDTRIFEIMYIERDLINKISDVLINKYKKIINSKDLYKFYNKYLIEKFYNILDFKQLSKEEYYKISNLDINEKNIKWAKYEEINTIFNNNCKKFKVFLKKVILFYSKFDNKVIGCYNVDRNIYIKILESHVGLNININKLEKWALNEINILNNKMKYYIKKINPNILDETYARNMLEKINKSQKYKSKKEYLEYYKEKIKKYKNIFINKYNFILYEDSNLVNFDNSDMGGAYYSENNFYLNESNWKEKYKYTAESLVLHEDIPGHHLQVHTSNSVEQNNSLLYAYFPSILNGFVEGWGLFSEKLGVDQTYWDKIGQIEYEIFRTLRIIVDIRIHYRGYEPDKIYEYMQNYLSFGKTEIMTEIYRYVCRPGQAVSYKIGSHVFSKILEKNNIKKYLDPKAIQIYKKIINDGPKPLKFLLEDYSISESDLFN